MSHGHNNHLSEVGVQKLYQLLADHHTSIFKSEGKALEEPISPSVPDYHRCPKCSHPLVVCPGCSSVTCDNSWCTVGYLVKLLSSCRSCFSSPALVKKCNQDNCVSHAHLIVDKICPDCIKPSDMVCPCGKTWVCGKCATDETIDVCRRCPKCRNYFCFYGCKYIEVCPECKKTTLCNDCMELEDEDMYMSNKEGSSITSKVTFPAYRTKCRYCRRRICADCFEERKFRCGECGGIYCRSDNVGEGFCLDCGIVMRLYCRGPPATRRCFQCTCRKNFQRSEDERAATLASENRS
ncbi:hypothetical protein DEU56DRAFT_840117 [Suillus clintonianus]|uniref:uncharacterized protein n=1 Tax=Suillus clintonianus TaxID=1904413 RepID=UPI001B86F45A|nr:uncharacterized protein DEU56DRAFT_840117 [Suillus clintonianus]KAG2116374.1 hypothetical protein DEU56DRAFT_840117 [Suillus clintonianus]